MEGFQMRHLVGVVVAVACFMQVGAGAGTIQITGSGTWNADAPTTDYSAPNASWSFSFDVPDPLDANPTSMVTNASYLLNGAPIAHTITSVQFYTPSLQGLFNLNFGYVGFVSLFGPQVIDPSTLGLFPGMYPAMIDVNIQNRITGTGTGMVDVGISSPVPEPSSIISGGLGLLAAVGLALRRGIRRPSSA
jgi:MYXO-CTERM domain-containing protein